MRALGNESSGGTSMIRLHVFVESQTEEAFIKAVLRPHLSTFGLQMNASIVISSVNTRLGKTFRGGLTNYQKLRNFIVRSIKREAKNDVRFTTMFDLYALPRNFPGFDTAWKMSDPYAKIAALEKAFANDIDDWRFLPYLQLHEFEALILAGLEYLPELYDVDEAQLGALAREVRKKGPELVNDGSQSAPSKRLMACIPDYNKLATGLLVTEAVTIPGLVAACPHFGQWVTQLQALEEQA